MIFISYLLLCTANKFIKQESFTDCAYSLPARSVIFLGALNLFS